MKKLYKAFFADKTILITGHTGFIGSWLSIWLNELGANVIGYALKPHSQNDNFVLAKLDEKITSIIGDIRNYENIVQVFKKYSPEIVFHLAAQPIVRKSYEIPKETFDVNSGGTVNILEAFRKDNKGKILINFTTDKVYENLEKINGYTEEDRLGGFDPYSYSKSCSEFITYAYRRSYFNKASKQKVASSVRSGNVIGGGDWQVDRLIPDCMNAIKNETEIVLRNPKSIRPWQFVLEPIRGFLMLAKKMYEDKDKYSGSWNFGPGNDSLYSVEDIVKCLINHSNKGHYCESVQDHYDLHETKILVLDNSKAQKLLNWYPILDFDETIKLVCDWYFQEKIDYDFDVKQLNDYIKIVNKNNIW